MKLHVALILTGFAGVACAQTVINHGMDRTERPSLQGDWLQEMRGLTNSSNWTFGVMPKYTYWNGGGVQLFGPGVSLFIGPPHGNGIGATTLTYKTSELNGSGFHEFEDFFLADMRLTPNSFPFVLSATFTSDHLRNDARFTGIGVTGTKTFAFGPGQTLEFNLTGTSENFHVDGEGGGGGGGGGGDLVRPRGIPARPSNGTVYDSSVGMFYDGGVALIFDYLFKNDIEGTSGWLVETRIPLGKNIVGRFGLAQNSVTGFQFGYKF